ncbi:hypothetical protein D6C84_04263 [Aureobasidium pullulans]|uniref:Uncharacterized protein n=1 Tax=Aureobasidium pullulans TaxID=5580 RepID=A0A4S9XY07_AURPU|nr:hypothetical protein D6C84_04263 [Aureobasidium pullulans]
MSFGFSIGDFLAAVELGKKFWDRVQDSPIQIKNTREDVETISAFIQAEQTRRLDGVKDPFDRARIEKSLDVCRRIVQDLQSELNKFADVGSADKSFRAKLKQSIQSLRWDQKEGADARGRILTSLTLLEGEFRRLDSQTLRHTDEVVKDTQAGVERLHKREDVKEQALNHERLNVERQAILNWICPSEIDYADKQSELVEKRQQGIGEWFLGSRDFEDWLHGTNTTLMCIGMPGVGKTMITSLVVSRVLKKYKDDSGIGLAYIYCQFARHQEQTSQYLMSSILRQLVGRQTIIPDAVKSLYRESSGKTRLRPDEMSDLLDVVVSNLTRSIIMVDALDELPGFNGARDAIRRRLEDCHLFQGQVDFRDKVTSRILRAANGVYLIAILYAEHLSLFPHRVELLDALDEIDHTSDPYKTVYEQTMRRITSDNHPNRKTNMALTILCYSFFAKRPLRIDELSHALAVKAGSTTFDKDRITDTDVSEAIARSCAGLIVLDKTNNTVNMFHKTLHDYLVDHHSKWFPDGGESLGRTCVAYLSLDDFAHGPCPEVDPSSLWSRSLAQDKTRLFRKRIIHYPFYEYASQYWQDHIRGSQSETSDLVIGFLANAKKLSASCQTLKLTAPDTTGVHIAVRFSLERSLKCYVERFRPQLDAKDNFGRTPLSHAAELNNLEAFRLLVNAGSDPNVLAGGQNSWDSLTPLSYAAQNGHEHMIKALLDSGANPNQLGRTGRSALTYAAEGSSEATTRLLLERGCDPNCQDSMGRTSLTWAKYSVTAKAQRKLLRNYGAH